MTARTTTTILLLAAALAVGCGSDQEPEPSIPADSSQALLSRLDEIQRRFEFGGGACADVQDDSEPAMREIVASLPPSVDADVRSALEQSIDRLFELTAEQCDAEEAQTETEAPPPTPETQTETVPPETQTETVPPETVPPETTPPETSPPETPAPDQDEGDGTGGGGALVPEGNG
jgi:outer membrane biosynthesis protein TonB